MTRSYLRYVVLAVFSCCSVYGFSQVSPTENKTGDSEDFRDIAHELRCPTCTGLSILDSDAPFSVQIKNEVRSQLASGKSQDEIMKFFVERYGPWILRSPPVEGVNALAWFVPVGAMILGPLLIWFFLGRRRRDSREGGGQVRSTEAIVLELKARLSELGVGTEEVSK